MTDEDRIFLNVKHIIIGNTNIAGLLILVVFCITPIILMQTWTVFLFCILVLNFLVLHIFTEKRRKSRLIDLVKYSIENDSKIEVYALKSSLLRADSYTLKTNSFQNSRILVSELNELKAVKGVSLLEEDNDYSILMFNQKIV